MKSWGLSLLNVSKARNNSHFMSAFTIVELLVVIVVIGVLAAITIVSYTGVTNRASLASLQSDLSNASTKLKAYQTIYGSYPTLDANNCPVTPTVDNNYCLKFSPGNTIATSPFAGYVPNNSTTPQTFSLTLSSNGIQGVITESTKPSILTPAPLNPVADWIATPQGDHYGNYYDTVTKTWASVTRSTPKTIYDPATQKIYDVPVNKLAINPWSTYQPGGSAAVIEEARTNYLLNSYFSSDSNFDGLGDEWISSGNGTAPVMWNLIEGVYGSSQHFTLTGVAGQFSKERGIATGLITGFTAGDIVTASAWIKGTSIGVSYYIDVQAYDSVGTYLSHNGLSPSVTSTWTRFSDTYTLPINATQVQVVIKATVIDEGDIVDMSISGVQLEKGSFATSYIPSTTAAVTRNADVVTIPTAGWNTAAGTFASAHGTVNSGTGTGYLFSSNVDGLNRTYLAQSSTGVLTSVVRLGDIPYNAVISGATGNRVSMMRYKTGETVSAHSSGFSIIRGSVVLPSDAALNTTANIGHQGNGAYTNAPISRLTVYSSALSDSEILSVSNAIKDGQ